MVTVIQPKTSKKRILAASLIGSAIEYFDFFLYGTIAALVFNKLFFPSEDPFISLILAYASFGITFFIRPIGGIVFSHIGDKFGRKKALVITLSIMGIATLAIGLLPTYAQIGIWAPILLVLCRMLQGIGLGGEFGGSLLLAVESAPEGKKGLYGVFPVLGIPIGMLLGTLCVSLLTLLPEAAFLSWGWRIPFILSVFLVLFGLWIRKGIDETEAFESAKEKGNLVKIPFVETIKYHWKSILVTLGIKFAEVAPFYIFATFFISYATESLGYARTTALNIVTVATLLAAIMMVIYANASDKVGRKRMFFVGAITIVLYAFPYYYLINLGSLVWVIVAQIIGLGLIWPSIQAIIGTLIAEMFPPQVGYTGISIGFQTGSAIGGGTAPMIATALLAIYNNSWIPLAIYLMIVCSLSAIAIIFVKPASTEEVLEEVELYRSSRSVPE